MSNKIRDQTRATVSAATHVHPHLVQICQLASPSRSGPTHIVAKPSQNCFDIYTSSWLYFRLRIFLILLVPRTTTNFENAVQSHRETAHALQYLLPNDQ